MRTYKNDTIFLKVWIDGWGFCLHQCNHKRSPQPEGPPRWPFTGFGFPSSGAILPAIASSRFLCLANSLHVGNICWYSWLASCREYLPWISWTREMLNSSRSCLNLSVARAPRPVGLKLECVRSAWSAQSQMAQLRPWGSSSLGFRQGLRLRISNKCQQTPLWVTSHLCLPPVLALLCSHAYLHVHTTVWVLWWKRS